MKTGTRAWAAAISVSLLLHGAVVAFAPSFARAPKEEPVMMVKLTFSEKPKAAPPDPARTEQPKPQPAQPAIKQPAPIKKTVVKKADKPAVPTKTEISAEPSDEPQTQGGEDTSAQTSGVSGGATGGSSDGVAGGTGTSDAIVDAGSLAVTKKVTPDYPSFSRKRKEEGTVKIIITIENGGVTKAEVEQSSGYERLDASAVRAVKQWRFDHPGKVRARVPFTFKLK